MKLAPVDGSTSIQAIGYDPDSQELHVQFRSGGTTYTYPGVTPDQHSAFVNSESKGQHFQQHIRSAKAKRAA